MTPRTPADSFADAAKALLQEHDLTDLLLRLTRDATRFAGGDAAGLLVRAGAGLEVLSSTSHAATQLELFQAMSTEGPCVDVLEAGAPVVVAGRREIVDRWPTVGRAIVDAGFNGVHASPVAWQGGTIGGLNLFRRAEQPPDAEQRRTAQAFADMLALAMVQPDRPAEQDVDRRLARALGGRVTVEQAKGVLAQQHGLDMAAAYEELVDRSTREGRTLTDTAREVIGRAQQRP
ncbi:GAF and ANTAR domain-containing protein [Puerhibacterium sp. TATVAM-FAB25]|uniref:GAF and ANTAR domain-containing protein n=1 Tax=Puerhibacterium sp. TATVAM-FAB25 TaxID=3093699 RepID=UPI00397887F6